MLKKESGEVEYRSNVRNADVEVIKNIDCIPSFTEQGVPEGAFYKDTRCIRITSKAYFEMVSTLIYIKKCAVCQNCRNFTNLF